LDAVLLSLPRPVFRKESCVLFHINCPECGSHIVKTRAPTAADANSEFDKAIADIKVLGATPETEPSSSKEQGGRAAAELASAMIFSATIAVVAGSLRSLSCRATAAISCSTLL
jgi:hypothetical protein